MSRSASCREPERSAGNQRLYGQRHWIGCLHPPCARSWLPLEAIRDLLSCLTDPDQSCAAADAIARAQLAEVESRLARLTALKGELERMVVQCAGGRIADCRVIEVLGDHSLCATDHQSSGERGEHRESTHHLRHLLGAALAEIAGCFAVWAWMRQGASALWLVPRPGGPGRFRLAADPCPGGIRGAGLRGLWRGLYRRLAPLAVGVERQRPDTWDLTGAAICLAGAAVILLAPRAMGS